MIQIAEALKKMEWTATELPPLSDCARSLLTLDEDDREDPRLLSLFARRDPVLLGKLLSLANSAMNRAPGGKPITSIEGAIRQLGVTSAYAMMLGTAMAATVADKIELAEVRRFLVQHSFTRWNTARRLCKFLSLDSEQSFVLQLAAILEPMGIFAALLEGGEISRQVRDCIEDAIRKGGVAVCSNCDFDGYTPVSAEIAADWATPQRVVDALAALETEDGALVRAIDALVAAKLKVESQAEALTAALSSQPRWRSLTLDMEIDLVQFG